MIIVPIKENESIDKALKKFKKKFGNGRYDLAEFEKGLGDILINKDFEFFNAMSLGAGNNNLHGFRKNRYLGRSMAYASLELRLKLTEIKSYLLPGPFGITGFYDIGRVWMVNQPSRTWHSAYGGGIYFIPFNLFVVSFTAGFTPQEKLLNFNLGSRINVTF